MYPAGDIQHDLPPEIYPLILKNTHQLHAVSSPPVLRAGQQMFSRRTAGRCGFFEGRCNVGTMSGTKRLANRPSCYVGSVSSSSIPPSGIGRRHSRAGRLARPVCSTQRPSPSRNPGTLPCSCRNYDIICASRSVEVLTIGNDVCIRRVTRAVFFARRGRRRSALAARAALARTCRKTR
jgi:hypothetical protein